MINICIYIVGLIMAVIAFAIVICKIEKKLTVGTLTLSLLISAFSWLSLFGAIIAILIVYVDWSKELWRKKE